MWILLLGVERKLLRHTFADQCNAELPAATSCMDLHICIPTFFDGPCTLLGNCVTTSSIYGILRAHLKNSGDEICGYYYYQWI